MAEDIGKKMERYVGEMKKVAGEAQTEFEKAAHEFDRIGRQMYDDMKTGMQGSENVINNVRVKMMNDLDKELPHLKSEMQRFQDRLEHYMQEMQNEIKRITK
jgi:hypothetical protein